MRKAILMCTCSFSCPSMKDINFAELGERIRMELPHDFMLMHPRLCEENGEQLMKDLLKDDVVYITPACKAEKTATRWFCIGKPANGKSLEAGFSVI